MQSQRMAENIPPEGSAPFDLVASDYDATFTDTSLGRRQREIVHRYVGSVVGPTFRVLELNCGTGHDALWLAGRAAGVVATDVSGAMVAITAAKAAASPHGERVQTRRMAIEELRRPEVRASLGRFDMIFSDFDGLNCLPDLAWLPDAFADLLLPNGHVVLVFMSPVCAMEILYMLATLRPGRALQRMRRGGLEVHIGDGHLVRTHFHGVRRAARLFARRFVTRRTEAVGLLTPPTLMRTLYERHTPLFDRLVPLERRLSPLLPFNRLGDHVLLHVQLRRESP